MVVPTLAPDLRSIRKHYTKRFVQTQPPHIALICFKRNERILIVYLTIVGQSGKTPAHNLSNRHRRRTTQVNPT